MTVRAKQVRVLRNVLIGSGVCGLVLWWLRGQLWEHRDALGLGCLIGIAAGSSYWWRLRRKVARRDRRYERNKIFVHYLNLAEVLIATIAFNPYLAIPLGLLLLASVFLSVFSAYWWTVLASSLGLTATIVVAGWVVHYERHYGPLYYQYNTESWSGAEGLLYQVGTVVAPLCPSGKVKLQGALWNAVSLSGEAIEVGEQVEVISIERLTLYVDRLRSNGAE
ncbi:NfeD family protein [Candidatus Entotheonella palauensis]|uniref:Nodulation protein NodD n=1 Tax=Candidatus Entotheonella gemina TaxID=1429439 RepID=W4MAU3_9BACT|nr:NfeD family protein [Candidatus Entotheonella palauensis]ETX07499.1 MAG: nodulation protein NodD [Candidatus Entotheonella gemina]